MQILQKKSQKVKPASQIGHEMAKIGSGVMTRFHKNATKLELPLVMTNTMMLIIENVQKWK